MSKFNKTAVRPAVSSPVKTEATPSGRTNEGAPGYARDAKGELFLLAVSNMVGESTFYEKAGDRDGRFRQLVHTVAVEDGEWMARFLPWLRGTANMRSAPLVAALEAVKARLDAGMQGGNRELVSSVLQRADEPGEALAYWTSTYGRAIPKPVKRGVADAVQRLYTERNLAKYDTDSKGFRFGDVIDLIHPSPHPDKARWQGDLFAHALDRRHGRDKPIPESLAMLRKRAEIMAVPLEARGLYLVSEDRYGELDAAGFTWESLAGWLQGPMDAVAWSTIIPSMGIFALCRNLRNFDDAGVSDEVAERVAAKISDPEQVAKSRMFPFRFYAAYKHAPSLRWAHPLEKAITHSLGNVPTLTGRTLVLVDQSPSMFPGYYFSTPNKSDITLADQAKIFGSAVALRAESADLVQYGGVSEKVEFRKSDSLLKVTERFHVIEYTDTSRALRSHYNGHTRVVIVTDEQTGRHSGTDVATAAGVPADVPVYVWNMAGYEHGHGPSGHRNRHTFGGLTDAAFRLIPLLEAGRNADWPF